MKDIIARTSDGTYIVITEGTGDNLFQEDIDAGYVDYVNYETYKTLEQARNNDDTYASDGGMVYLKEAYQTLVVKEVLSALEDELGGELEYVEDLEY